MGALCGLVALACLVPRSRGVAVRVVGLVVFGACCWYLWTMIDKSFWNGRPSQPSLGNGLFAFLFFGLPGAYVAFRGVYPRRGSSTRAFNGFGKQERQDRPPKLLLLSFKKIPADAKFVLEGIPIEQPVWQEIEAEVSLRMRSTIPRWRKSMFYAGAWIIVVLIMVAMTRQWFSIAAIFAALLIGAVWIVGWNSSDRTTRRRTRRQVMIERGIPICVDCGYNLTSIGEQAGCPECGWQRPGSGPIQDIQ